MSSIRRKVASRLNGARSKGPKTPEGKRRVAANALRHGLCSSNVVLENESAEGFDALVAQYTDRFGPVDALEEGMIEEMAASYWRLRRGWTIEQSLMNTALANQPDAADKAGEAARSAAAGTATRFPSPSSRCAVSARKAARLPAVARVRRRIARSRYRPQSRKNRSITAESK